jgi:GT2 family glycosyltransferase
MQQTDLSIIIVSYNTRQLTTECLQSLHNNVSKKITYETIVVDNASSDDSVEYIKKHFPEVKMIDSKKNEGFSRANNHGVKISKGRYVLFLNSDTVVYKNSLEYMVEFMDEHNDAGAATCFLEIPTGDVDDAAHRGFPTPWNALCHFSGVSKIFPNSMLFNGYHLAWKDLTTKTHEIDALAGAFMIVRRTAGEQVGWWNEDYFFYGEDLDFCYSLKEKGWKIYFVPEVKVLHYKGMSSGIKEHSKAKSKASLETKIWVTNHRFDAMKIFYKKHYQKKYPNWLRWLVLQAVEVKRNYTLSKLSA